MTGHLPDDGEPGIEAWGDPDWRASATAWLDDQLRAAGLKRTGDVVWDRSETTVGGYLGQVARGDIGI